MVLPCPACRWDPEKIAENTQSCILRRTSCSSSGRQEKTNQTKNKPWHLFLLLPQDISVSNFPPDSHQIPLEIYRMESLHFGLTANQCHNKALIRDFLHKRLAKTCIKVLHWKLIFETIYSCTSILDESDPTFPLEAWSVWNEIQYSLFQKQARAGPKISDLCKV